ncbi:MAG: hypothetical protein LBL52_01290 [Rickettsiales bacterium]|jgi:hypothetical protein|nr:hypothetical protein [Rickettsiales bacterium]
MKKSINDLKGRLLVGSLLVVSMFGMSCNDKRASAGQVPYKSEPPKPAEYKLTKADAEKLGGQAYVQYLGQAMARARQQSSDPNEIYIIYMRETSDAFRANYDYWDRIGKMDKEEFQDWERNNAAARQAAEAKRKAEYKSKWGDLTEVQVFDMLDSIRTREYAAGRGASFTWEKAEQEALESLRKRKAALPPPMPAQAPAPARAPAQAAKTFETDWSATDFPDEESYIIWFQHNAGRYLSYDEAKEEVQSRIADQEREFALTGH